MAELKVKSECQIGYGSYGASMQNILLREYRKIIKKYEEPKKVKFSDIKTKQQILDRTTEVDGKLFLSTGNNWYKIKDFFDKEPAVNCSYKIEIKYTVSSGGSSSCIRYLNL